MHSVSTSTSSTVIGRLLRRVAINSLLSIGLVSALAAASSAQFPVANWKGDANFLDSSGNGHTLTGTNVQFADGLNQRAFLLDATSSLYTSAPTLSVINPGFAVTAWVYFNQLDYSSNSALPNTILAQDNGGGTQEKFVFYYNATDHALGVHMNGGNGASWNEVVLPTAVTIDTWNNFTVSGDVFGKTLTFYENGDLIGAVDNVVFSNPTAEVSIGSAEGIGHLVGGMQDVAIYGADITGYYAVHDSMPIPPIFPIPPRFGPLEPITPEPGTVAMFASLAAGAAISLRRKRKK